MVLSTTHRSPEKDADSARFTREAHRLCSDLFEPDPRRYWADFLITIFVVYATLAVYLHPEAGFVLRAVALVGCGLAMYRAAVFTHEIVHRRAGAFRRFAVIWNLLCGIPLLMPSFLYGDHRGHHASHAYGTWADPEYLVRGSTSVPKIGAFLLLPLIYPLLALTRFLVLAPLALLSRRIDHLVWRWASSLYVMNELYRREYDAAARSRSRWLQELACSTWAWTAVWLVATEQVPAGTWPRIYVLFVFWSTINQVRTLAAHQYRSAAAQPLTYLDQMLDTNTFGHGAWLPNLWAPLGLRYHALHHLLPSMPYHAMGRAHRRLMEQLPPDSPYHQTVRAGLGPVLAGMIRHAAARAGRTPER